MSYKGKGRQEEQKGFPVVPTVAAVGVLLVIGVVFLLMRGGEAREVRQVVKDAVRYAEAKDVEACITLLDPSYTDSFGNTYENVLERARREIGRVESIDIKVRDIEAEVMDGTATVNFEVRFIAHVEGGSGKTYPVVGLVQQRGSVFPNYEQVRLELVKSASGWRVCGLEMKSEV